MLPNLIVIGAMKSATSSLHYYLSTHPEVFMSELKELDFFIAEKNWNLGLEWYESNFPTDKHIRGESSPNYTAHPGFAGVPERMHSVVPEAKLIYIVRDPIQRMISHYIHSVHRRRESRPADQALMDFDTHYYYRSRYYLQLEQYLAFFDRSKILVLSNEELMRDRQSTMQRTFRFLAVDENFRSPAFDDIVHASTAKRRLTPAGVAALKAYQTVKRWLPASLSDSSLTTMARRKLLSRDIERPILSPKVRETIKAQLAEDVAQLRAFTGRKFEEWSL